MTNVNKYLGTWEEIEKLWHYESLPEMQENFSVRKGQVEICQLVYHLPLLNKVGKLQEEFNRLSSRVHKRASSDIICRCVVATRCFVTTGKYLKMRKFHRIATKKETDNLIFRFSGNSRPHIPSWQYTVKPE